MTFSALRSALLWLLPATAAFTLGATSASAPEEKAIQVQFLEIVTPDVDATCTSLAKLHGVKFSDPVLEFGNARTAALEGGGHRPANDGCDLGLLHRFFSRKQRPTQAGGTHINIDSRGIDRNSPHNGIEALDLVFWWCSL